MYATAPIDLPGGLRWETTNIVELRCTCHPRRSHLQKHQIYRPEKPFSAFMQAHVVSLLHLVSEELIRHDVGVNSFCVVD